MRDLAVLFYSLALGLVVTGFVFMFKYEEDGFNYVVGGDAYNYIIMGVRGVGFFVVALAFTVVASLCSFLHHKNATITSANQNEVDEDHEESVVKEDI